MRKIWFAVAGAALLMTGAATAGTAFARVNDLPPPAAEQMGATAAAAAPEVKAATAARTAPKTSNASDWSNSTRFMQVESGSIRNGTVYLKVRPAKKNILGESFETVPVPGPYTEVKLVAHARILLLDGESGSPEAFVDTLAKRTAAQRVEAFDLHFGARGIVSQVDWLYVLKAPAPAPSRKWSNSTKFMQVESGSIRNGTVYLKVRPAKKNILGESFETVPVPGPYTEVKLVAHARILLLDGESGSPEAFVDTLAKRTAAQRDEAFDVIFDGRGHVSQVDWLYVP